MSDTDSLSHSADGSPPNKSTSSTSLPKSFIHKAIKRKNLLNKIPNTVRALLLSCCDEFNNQLIKTITELNTTTGRTTLTIPSIYVALKSMGLSEFEKPLQEFETELNEKESARKKKWQKIGKHLSQEDEMDLYKQQMLLIRKAKIEYTQKFSQQIEAAGGVSALRDKVFDDNKKNDYDDDGFE